MRRIPFLVLAVILPVAWASPAQAAPPIKDVIDAEETFVSDDCGFPVETHITGTIDRATYTDGDGEVTKIHYVFHTQFSLTNLDTSEVYEVQVPGVQTETPHPDGSVTLEGSGVHIFSLEGFPGPTLWRGRFVLEFSADGEVDFTRHGSPPVDLCAELAA